MEIENEEKKMTIDKLSDILKEIYNIAKNRELTYIEIKEEYGISIYAISDLLDLDVKQLEVENLQNTIEVIKTSKNITSAGAKLNMGNRLVGFIKNSMSIDTDRKKHYSKEYYEEFYKCAQQIFKKISNGERIEDVSTQLGLKLDDTEELLFRYSELLNRLQARYRRSCDKNKILESYKIKYFFDDDISNYIKEGTQSAYVNRAIRLFLIEKGIIENIEGGEHEQ